MITIPPYLKKGDTIGMIAPAGYMSLEKMHTAIDVLESWGYNIVLGTTTNSNSDNYFSGTDAERRADLQQMLDDKAIQAIFCARGGYGMSRMIDDLSFKKFRKSPKWIIGYSDITVLQTHIFTNYKIGSLHAPMAAAFDNGEFNNPYILSLKSVLEGHPMQYECEPHPYNKSGEAEGVLVGGNLCLLAHLMGSRSEINTKDKILFLEDVGEYLYNIDRMLLQLKRGGKLKKIAGLIIGGFTDCKDTDRPFGKGVHEIIQEQLKGLDVPVCFDFPVSHERENYALKIGATVKLSVSNNEVLLKEIEKL